MVVEDEQSQRLFICDLIDSQNMDVIALSNGLMAQNYLLENPKTPIDLILLDYNMPAMDGLEFLTWLKEVPAFKHIIVVMMSTEEEQKNLHYCLNQGATTFFIKPLKPQNIKSLPKLIVEKKTQEPTNECKKQYDRLSELGSGGNATVELVMERSTKIEYARKIITIAGNDDSVLKQAKNEVELFKVLDSPFILKYIESYTRVNTLYIIMEYAEKGELSQLIKRQKATVGRKFTQAEILKWLTQCSLGLALMHSKNIMHRDLKPQNLFLTKDNDLKLGDFGISKEIKTTDKLTNTFCGTPYYMPPEVYRREAYSNAADIWALGCTFYETMTLEKPFEVDPNANEKSLEEKIQKVDPQPPLPGVYTEPLKKIIMNMLSKRPEDRMTIFEILRTNIIKETIMDMIKNNKNLESHIMGLIPLEKEEKKQQRPGSTALGLLSEPIDKEKAEKTPELIIATILKTLELKTIKNGMFSKFNNAFTGGEFQTEFQELNKYTKDVNFKSWVEFIIKKKILLVLKGDPNTFDKESIYTLAYLQDKPNKNDLFDTDEPLTDVQKLIGTMMLSAKETIRIYKDFYMNKEDVVFNPFEIPDFLYFLRLFSELKKVDLISFSKGERMAYFLNVYQLVSFHRLALEAGGSGKKAGLLSSVGLAKGATYKLGSEAFMTFSADDILHGVLRKNTKKYSAYFAQFKGGDSRATLISNFDKRIFVLYYLEHCELKDIQMEKFDPNTWESRLDSMLKAWASQNMYYNPVEKSISIPLYLENNYLADYNNQEIDMVLDVDSFYLAQ